MPGKIPDVPPADPLLGPLPGKSLLDDLLSGDSLGAPLPADQSSLLAGSPLAPAVKKSGRKALWDSTWFLIVVGLGLGLALVALFVAWRLLAK